MRQKDRRDDERKEGKDKSKPIQISGIKQTAHDSSRNAFVQCVGPFIVVIKEPGQLCYSCVLTAEDMEGKTEEEIEMMKLMGFSSFDSSKVSCSAIRWNHLF